MPSNRTKGYSNASEEMKKKVDQVLSMLSNSQINEVKEVLRIASNEVYAASKKSLDSITFKN